MTILKTESGNTLTMTLEGRLDTVTSPQLEDEAKKLGATVKTLVLDFKALDYVSSAGLRVILALQKVMNKQGSMKITNVNESIMEVFEVTGFSDILTIE